MTAPATLNGMAPLPRLSGLALHVDRPRALAAFYCEALGMAAEERAEGIRLGYGGGDAVLALRPAQRHTHSTSPGDRYRQGDRYWKIGITLPDVDIAHAQLSARLPSWGVKVSEPRQFRDIGYMCHLADPEGFEIELLQHSFAGEARSGEGDPGLPLGGGARIGQLTLRTDEIEADLAHYRDRLGMKPLAFKALPDLDFDLHFLAFTDEAPPDGDPGSARTLQWLWRRPYTTLELQHRRDGRTIRHREPGEHGHTEVLIDGPEGFQGQTD